MVEQARAAHQAAIVVWREAAKRAHVVDTLAERWQIEESREEGRRDQRDNDELSQQQRVPNRESKIMISNVAPNRTEAAASAARLGDAGDTGDTGAFDALMALQSLINADTVTGVNAQLAGALEGADLPDATRRRRRRRCRRCVDP